MSNLDSLTREELIGIVLEQHRVIEEQSQEIAKLRAEIEELRSQSGKGGDGTPAWVKANSPQRKKKARKKRYKAFHRPPDEPTEWIEHALETCPKCGRKLTGGSEHHHRDVIELPMIQIRYIRHKAMARYCGVCGKTYVPKLDLTGQVIGKHRIGIRVMSLISHLHIAGKMTLREIQKLLEALCGLHLGLGEITGILHAVARHGQPDVEEILKAIRGSPAANVDETGWRENGKNGYTWAFCTPGERYFIRGGRGGQIPKDVLGEDYGGIVGSDFYSVYDALLCRHQRCWVHLLRDLKKLVEDNPDSRGVAIWAGKVKAVYERAKGYKSEDPKARLAQRIAYQEELSRLARPYCGREVPQRVLAKRIEAYLPEMFMFVEHPEIMPDNNLAERAIRPVVTARKVSGGTRSKKGTETKMALISLFGTWTAKGENALENCRRMLGGEPLAPTAAIG